MSTIRKYCITCAGKAEDVDKCLFKKCPLYQYRDGKKESKMAIKKYCIECSGGSLQEMKLCNIKKCKLWEIYHG